MRKDKEMVESQCNATNGDEFFSTRESAPTSDGRKRASARAARSGRAAAKTTRMSKPLVALCTLLLTVMLTVSLVGMSSPAVAAETNVVKASSLTNNNIGKHPLHTLISWDATGENLKDNGRFNWSAAVTGDYTEAKFSGGTITSNSASDDITPTFIKTVVNSTLKDDGGDTILEQSPTFTYKRETVIVGDEQYAIYLDSNGKAVYFDKVAQEIALKYGFREGKELVFNINDEGTAARVWADAVLFTQHIGPAESIPFVSNVDYDRYKNTGLIPDTTMYAFEQGDYIFRTKLTAEEINKGEIVYNEYSNTYGVWEKYSDKDPKDGNPDYVKKSDGKVQRYSHFFVNDNGSYFYHTDSKTMTTSEEGEVETKGVHKVKYSYYEPNFDATTGHTKLQSEGGTLNIHGPVYRGNYFIENGRYEGWGTTSAYGGAKLMGQYITVRLNCDWTAKEILTNIYTVEGKTTSFDYVYTKETKGDANYEYYSYNTQYVSDKNRPTTVNYSAGEKTKYFQEVAGSDGYTVYYDASSIPFATGNTHFDPYNELCAFSNGRINVPVGSYIVLDLNGHKIDRALDASYDDNLNNSAYQYFGSVFSVNEFARLEVYDGTAFENASDTHISGEYKNDSDKNYGANGGLTTDQAGTITGGYVTHQYKKDGGNGRSTGEGNSPDTIGDTYTNWKRLELNVDGDKREDADQKNQDDYLINYVNTSSIPDDNQAKGAAIHIFAHSDFVFHSGTISGNNAASQYGGAVYLLSNSSMTMFDGYIINNQAHRIGGGIYLADLSASVLTMYNGVVGYNYGGAGKLGITESNDLRERGLRRFRAIENYGGGIALRTKAYCNLYGGELVGNYSFGPGAGMYIQEAAVGTLAGVTIKGNHTYGSPGGQGSSFAPYGGGGGIFVGGMGARIGFRGALQIVENYRDNVITKREDDQNELADGDWEGVYSENVVHYTSIVFSESKATDNLHLTMQEMTTGTEYKNPNENGKNKKGDGDAAAASTNFNVEWNSNATIVISGPLIEKGIVANIGITMQAANKPFNSTHELVFTQAYKNKGDSQHNDLEPHYFFTSDNPAYSIQQNADTHEAYLQNTTLSTTQLTWVVEGSGIDADTKAKDGAPAPSTLRVVVKSDGTREYYYKNPNRTASGAFKDTLAKVEESTNIESEAVKLSNNETTKKLKDILDDSFVATSGSLDFEYSMLNVTRVAVYAGSPDFNTEALPGGSLAYWEVSGAEVNSTFYTTNFRFKLGEQDFQFDNQKETESEKNVPVGSPMYKAIMATDKSISYAGLYSFLYKATDESTRYNNPTFKINIKQAGIEATRICYFNGQDVTERKPVAWKEDERFTWNIGTDPTKNLEPYAPYFLYRGDYYYPVLSADFNNPIKGDALVEKYKSVGGLENYIRQRLTENVFYQDDYYIRVVNPEKSGDCLFVRKNIFSGYVLNFRYSNQYFGVTHTTITGGESGAETTDVAITTDVHFGAHDGGGVEYKTMHKKPGSDVAEGQYVDGVKHAGTYLVTFVASSNGLADDTGVYFASNNFAFNAEVRLQVKPAEAEVQLTNEARVNLGYTGARYEDRQIAEFDNTSDTKIIPVNDSAVIFRYFLFDDKEIWTSSIPTLSELQNDVLGKEYQLKADVTAQNYKEDGTPNIIPGTQVEPTNARTYIVVVTLELDMNYEEYDYVFIKDDAHLVHINIDEDKQSKVWAYWFTIDPANVDPYEDGTTGLGKNTKVALSRTKNVYYNGLSYGYLQNEDGSFDELKFSEQANLPNIIFEGSSETVLTFEQDYDIEYVGFDPTNDPKSSKYNFLDASVGLSTEADAPQFGDYKFGYYNLAVKITFGGKNKNYVNTTPTAGAADGKGTAYEDGDGAFYIYFRIVPIIVTASANISYTYDGGSYDRGRWLDKRKDYPNDAEMYESIFFLAQDSIVTPADLITHQKDASYTMSYPGAPSDQRTLDDLWGGVEGPRIGTQTGEHTYDDTTFYKSRYTIGDVSVYYTNDEFIANGIQLGVGMYAFQTNNPDYQVSSYHLMTMDFDNEKLIDKAPTETGVIWLLTVGNVQSFASTNGSTDATNFIINSASYLNVNINQRNINGSDIDVKFNNEPYEGAEEEFPYAGVAYVPTVELSFTANRPSDSPAYTSESLTAERKKETITLTLRGAAAYDYYTTYNNNTTVSTDSSKAQVILNANKYSEGPDDQFSNNYYGSKTINFKIRPAVIEATINGAHQFTYDGAAKTLDVTYANKETYNTAILSPSEGFTNPIPNTADITTQYKKLENGGWGPTPPAEAGTYRVALYVGPNYKFQATKDFALYTDDDADTGEHRSVTTIQETSDLVIDPRKVYIGPGVDSETDNTDGHGIVKTFTYNRSLQFPQLRSTNICSVSNDTGDWVANYDDTIIPSSGNYNVTYTDVGMPDASSSYPNRDGFTNAGTYWMVIDLTSPNYIWGGFEVEDDLFTHEELSETRLAVQYTILASDVLLKPNEAISGAEYSDTDGTLHFTYDGTKHDVGVTVSSHAQPPLSNEFKLNPVSFKGSPSFTAGEAAYMSIYAGTYSFTVTFTEAAGKNYKWSPNVEEWNAYNPTNNSVIVKSGEETNDGNKIVFVDTATNTVTITYVIDPAKVYISSIDSKLYNREEQDDIAVNFKNRVETNSQVPTKYDISFKVSEDKNQWLYKNYDTDIAESEVNKANVPNAKLGKSGMPLNAGNYDVTVTLKDDDKNNFELIQQTEYKSSLNSDSEKSVTYSDVSADNKSAVALFVIERLGVYANQVVSSVMFDNEDHFNGDPYGITDGERYGGDGPWTIRFASSSGMTDVDGIDYNIRYEGVGLNGNTYLVIIKLGGYSLDKTRAVDAIYWREGAAGQATKLNASDRDEDIRAAFDEIKKLGLFKNAKKYSYKLYFEYANVYIAGSDPITSQELEYEITSATINLGTLQNLTFNNEEQAAIFDENSFAPVGDTKLSATQIYNLLTSYNRPDENTGYTEKDSGYTVDIYAADGGNARLGTGRLPFNAGNYTVTVTLKTDNFTFSGVKTSTISLTIDPFDISSLDAEQFKVTLPDVRYTGMAMKTYISQVEVRINEKTTVTLVLLSTAATDGKLQLGKNGYDFNIASYDNNVNVSKATATARIVGSNNFTGEVTRTFDISKRQIHVNINDNLNNVYGVNLNSGVDKPSNLGDVRDVDWKFDDDNSVKSAEDITEMIDASVGMTYGSDDASIQKAIDAFNKLNGEAADKFVYVGDNLYVALSILNGSYNIAAEHQALLVGKWRIVGGATNENYEVSFSGNYASSGATDVAMDGGDAKYGYYQVVQRDISITPADLNIIYGNPEHLYVNNALTDGSQLYWTATSNYAGDAILGDDLDEITAGITLVIDNTNKSTSGWLNVGTYLIKVNAGEIGNLDGKTNASSVTECYTIKGIGTWVEGAMGAAVEVAAGIGGTYTVSPRDITVQIKPGMGYEYNNGEPYNDLDTDEKYNILKYMLEVAKKQPGNVNYTYDDLVSLINGTSFAEQRADAEGVKADDWSDLKLKFIKDAGVGANTYSVTTSWDNNNYNVTFEGASNSVTITPRKIIVHINDQHSIYGDDVLVGMTQGKSAVESETANWYAMLSNDSTYWDDSYSSDLDARINKGCLGEDNLDMNLTKEFGANVGKYYLKGSFSNNNYLITFEGEWTQASSTTEEREGDPTDNTAGIYKITLRPVKVTVLGQSGVYGGNQHTSIGSIENTHWSATQGTVGSGEGVVNSDSLGISITINQADGWNENSRQLNVGWYSVRVSYSNPNYNVTFEGDNSRLNGAQYVEEYNEHNTSTVTKHREGDAVTAYDVSNAYYIYARVISISIQPQSFTYSGKAPDLNQGEAWWSANNVINGSMPPILSGDQNDFNKAIVLELVEPTEDDEMYNVWKKWGMWSAGRYEGNSGIQATLSNKDGVDDNIFTNYTLSKDESKVLGVLRINPAEISVAHNGQSSTYNNQAPTIDQNAYTIESEETKVFSSRKWTEAESKFAEDATSDKDLLKFTFTFDGTDYGAGRHFINGNWTYPADNAHNPNYTVTFNTGTYTINKRELKVTIKDQYAIYGEKLWAGDGWWLETSDAHGDKTPNDKYWSVEVTNPNADDGGVYWINETDRDSLGISPVIEAQQGANARDSAYTIGGTWNSSNDDYNVTFVNGGYTIHKRAIKVHINDQGGVYGSFTGGAPVDQTMGNDANSGGWFVVGFDSTKQQEICKGHECDGPIKPFVVASDNLNISLTLGESATAAPGNYQIIGTCNNQNYEVTWVGGNKQGDDGYERDHGIFGLTKREVTVTVNDQSIEYGKLKRGVTTGFNQDYTARATNDLAQSNIPFVSSDNVHVELSVTVLHDGAGDYNKAGKYAITIRIHEGDKLIYSSLQSEKGTVSESDKYKLTVSGSYTDDDFSEGYKEGAVFGNTGAYEITKKNLDITVEDKSSVYGEAIIEWTFSMSGNMSEDESSIRDSVKLTIGDEEYATWSAKRKNAGVYDISAKLDNAAINNNYNVVFRTQYGVAYDEVSDEKVTAKYTVTKRMISVNIRRRGSTYGDELADLTEYEVSPIGNLTGTAIVDGDELAIELAIRDVNQDYNLSSTKHLKVGIYPIVGSWNNNPNYSLSFTGTWSNANTDTWREQRTENGLTDADEMHNTLDGCAGLYEVELRDLTITLGTEKPSSEYGDPIKGLDTVDNYNTEKSWGFEYGGSGRVGEDIIAFEMTTDARQGSGAKAYDITPVEGSYAAKDGNDNANYSITFKNGTYTVNPRLLQATLTEKDGATDEYGTPYVQDNKFDYTFTRVSDDYPEDKGLYKDEEITLVITPIETGTYTKSETGFYQVGEYMLKITANNNSNYAFTSMEGTSVRYHVTQRNITIYLNDQSSVFGETISVNQDLYKDDLTPWGWKVVSVNGIVTGNDHTDDLGIEIARADSTNINFKDGGYELTATIQNRNYNASYVGGGEGDVNGYERDHGVYTIKKRLIRIRILNQYSIYGETIKVSSEATAWAVVDPSEVSDKTVYSLLDGQTPSITLNIFTLIDGKKEWYSSDGVTSPQFTGNIGRGEYHIGVQTIGNANYDVEVEEKYLPDVENTGERGYLLEGEFEQDFGVTTTKKTIEVKNPVISGNLASKPFATYFVTIRPVTIKINDQNGVYGDYLTLNTSGEGVAPAYTIELGKYKEAYVTTGQPFVGDYKATFKLVTTAFDKSDITGEHPVGVSEGWSLDAGKYPIFGAEYHVFVGSRQIDDDTEAANLSHNYQFNFEGAYKGTETYETGTPFDERAGVYTVEKRQVSLTAKDSSVTYGGTSTEVLIPEPEKGNYQAIVSNSKTSEHEGVTHDAILDTDLDDIAIKIEIDYGDGDLSRAKALKVGRYTLKLTFTVHKNYEITAINGNFDVTARQASILIKPSAATATYLATIPEKWDQSAVDMFTPANVLSGDIIAFTMETVAKQGDAVGSDYKLSGTIGENGADNDNANYSITFTDGTFEITKKKVDVTIKDKRSEYGEQVDVNVKDGWELPDDWNKDADTAYTNSSDIADGLGITLSTAANDRTDVGDYQISGQYSIRGEVGKNYDLQFVGSWNASNPKKTNGNGGTLTIFKRSIVVVIKAQSITYRDAITLDQKAWFVWRDNHTATWDADDEYHVLGPKDTLESLRVNLVRGGATDTEEYGSGTGQDTYVGTYALVGNHTSTNYEIVFAYERADQDGFNYSTVKENEDGIFTITPYDITIKILYLNGDTIKYGGNAYVQDGGDLVFGATLINTRGEIWEYKDAKEFLPTELGYLSFRLGGKIESDIFAFMGNHPIVGYWGDGLTDKNASDYRMQFNYNVTFEGDWNAIMNAPERELGYDSLYDGDGAESETQYGKCGVIKISEADIAQSSREQDYNDGEENGSHWHGENWNREAAFSGNEPENPWHSMAVGNDDLAFAGNVLFGGQSETFGDYRNTKLAEKVTITYGNLKHDGVTVPWEDGGKAPEEQEVGKWTVDVTVSAPYHKTTTFTLTLTITRINVTVYLTNKDIEIEYGRFKLDGGEIVPTDPKSEQLNSLLKDLLFAEYDVNEYLDKSRSSGAITSTGTEAVSNIEDIVAYLLLNSDVVLSISTRSADASTGGYLIAQRYVLTIQAGDNMEIHFGGEYNNVIVKQRQLTATWTPDPNVEAQTHDDGKNKYVYTFGDKDISVVPYVTVGDILTGDLVLRNEVSTSVFDYAIYRIGDDGETLVNANVVRDVGTYKVKIRENISPTPDRNVDIANYITPVDEYVYIVISPAAITIVIEGQSREYGEPVNLDQEKWYIKTGDPSKDRPGGDHPKSVPGTGEPLEALGISLIFEGDDPVNAGKYAIRGKTVSTNYTLVFEGDFDATEEKAGTKGTFTITPRNVRVKVKNYDFVYGTDIHDNLADDANSYTFVHIVDGAERPDEIAVLPSDDIKLTISIKDPARTVTGYIKAGEYSVVNGYSNDNYKVEFADEKGNLEGASFYQVKVTVSKANIAVSIHGRQVNYGDRRPAMPENYNITGLAVEDKNYYDGLGLDRPDFIEFDIYDADTAEPLLEFDAGLDEKLKFDPVGIYIIIGKNVKGNEIGENYIVEFSGEWAASGRYTSEEYVGKAGKYEVVPRQISIQIGNVQSEYGDIVRDRDIPFELLLGANNVLAGNDKKEDLLLSFTTEAIITVGGSRRTNGTGVYDIVDPVAGNKNYTILSFTAGEYKVVPREIIIKLDDATYPYGDDHRAHLATASLNNGWSVTRANGKEGNGIAYPDTDDIVKQVQLTTTAEARSVVGEYDLTLAQNLTDPNYKVQEIVTAKYHVAKRHVQLTINDQKSEYGENHVLSNIMDTDFTFTLLESSSNKQESAIVFVSDDINKLTLHFIENIDVRTPAGEYSIDASWTDDNYDVTTTGSISEGDRHFGKYTIAKRKIVITLNATQSSEYGDEVEPNSDYRVGWTARRPDGMSGNAIVNDDELSLTLAVLDSEGRKVDSTYPVGEYALLVSATDFNVNYDVSYETQTGGEYKGSVYGHANEVMAVYTIDPRRIVVEFGGTSEYGDDIVINDISYRADGKEGPAIVNGDKLGYNWKWKLSDPTSGGERLAVVGSYPLDLSEEVSPEFEAARKNYSVTPAQASHYTVTPRKVTVKVKDIVKTYGDAFEDINNSEKMTELLDVQRTTEGASGDPILHNDIRFFSLNVIDGDSATLTDGRPYYAGVYNYNLVYTDNNENYDITVEYGHYTVVPKPITVNIGSKTSKYSEDIVGLTFGEIEGVLAGDELNIALSVLWGDEELDLKWHNTGVYAIKGVWNNPNYAVTFKGDLGEFGAYTIEKADNKFTKEYDGNGTVYLGDDYRDGDLPTSLWGNDSVRYEYYLDEAMTQRADFDGILDAKAGMYYVKAIVDEALNWKSAETTFVVNVIDTLGFSDGMDITAYVCIYASQFIILACALIFVKRKKNKNKKTNTSKKAGN